jgi:hypothetical protein
MNEVQFQELKQEVARLTQENAKLAKDFATLQHRFTEISQCIHVEHPDEGVEGRPMLSLRCSIISLVHPDKPNCTAGILGATREGAYLWLYGDGGIEGKARVTLDVENNAGRLLLLGKEAKESVQLWNVEPNGRGHIAVYENGKPRALVKAMDQGGGAVSVVHDDGTPRAGMVSTEEKGGEMFAVTPDMQMGVKITGEIPGGGSVIVNHTDGKAGVILGCVEDHGAVVIKDSKGNFVTGFPMPKDPEEE